jgi:transcriptional regulator with XRE-family HTH domain
MGTGSTHQTGQPSGKNVDLCIDQGLRQDATADGIGVSENFLAKVERGGTTVQWGKLFTVLSELGLHVEIDIPDKAMAAMAERDRKKAK